MIAKHIKLDQLKAGDEIILRESHNEPMTHGIVKEIELTEENERTIILSWDVDPDDIVLYLEQDEPIYLIGHHLTAEEWEKSIEEICRKISETANSEPVRYLEFKTDYGSRVIRSDEMVGRCSGCGGLNMCDCNVISWWNKMENWWRG